ncbi:MAG: hypothetical protein WCH46_03830 [bacterium]
MNNILELYRETKNKYELLNDFLNDKGYQTTPVTALSYYIGNMTCNLYSFVYSYFEEEEDFCYKCMYHRLDTGRKAIARYLMLENASDGNGEDIKEFSQHLVHARMFLNDCCLFLVKKYDMNAEEEHVHVENTYYREIQLEIDTE